MTVTVEATSRDRLDSELLKIASTLILGAIALLRDRTIVDVGCTPWPASPR